ncbi:9891_t:CDS:2 [Ambispora gerdemannii]|uniref:9891_t:CDS:1 n=1 Tax=Ambispora gerdemannii TaxID=144530 RepID=A0A9N8WRP9_9GLOM|nr:9891_t:CDS:2 [Ambispora gerdemannii]
MPKIVSSSTVSSSEQTNVRPEQHLHVYYCLCSEFILVIDAKLDRLPRRKTDNAYIIANGKRIYKLNAIEPSNNPIVLKRLQGYEKQYRLHCPRCNLFIAYEVTPKRKSGAFTYIVEGSLTDNQGVVPADAIDEKDNKTDQ